MRREVVFKKAKFGLAYGLQSHGYASLHGAAKLEFGRF